MFKFLLALILAPFALVAVILFICIVIGAVKGFTKGFKSSIDRK